MIRFDRVDKILDFAISREAEAHSFYKNAARYIKAPETRALLKELADEELSHHGTLQAVKEGKLALFRESGCTLDVDDCCARLDLRSDPELKDVLIFAVRKENEAIRLYKALARTLDWGGLRETFLLLAQEEEKHKKKFEKELAALLGEG